MKSWLYCCLTILTSFAYTEGFVEIVSESPRIVVFHHYLTDAECDHLIRFGAPLLARSTVVDTQTTSGKVDNARTSRGMFFPYNHRDAIIQSIEKKISHTTGLPEENGESIQLLHYTQGAEYKPHYDFFDPKTPSGAEYLKAGGQRFATFIMYLNTPEMGGETVFPRLGVKIRAQKGDALLFYNCDGSGNVDSRTLHGGAPVLTGEKWIATRWLRLGKFQ